MTKQPRRVWLDGAIQSEPSVPLLAHSLHYGVGAFEGIRAYRQKGGGSAVFRLQDHVRRLLQSCRLVQLSPRVSEQQITDGCLEVLRVNELEEGYLRPLVILGEGALGLLPSNNPVMTFITAWSWGPYLGEGALQNGIRCTVSSYCRPHPNTALSRGKLTGQYIVSVMAKREAKQAGFDEALLLDLQGNVAEGSGENIFVVRSGRLITPPLAGPILPGITRETVLTLAREEGLPVEERTFPRDELLLADEVFLTGTAAELTPVREIDSVTVGQGVAGPITQRLQQRYFDAVTGASEDHPEWLTRF